MISAFYFFVFLSLIPSSFGDLAESLPWHKKVPENQNDLRIIQSHLQTLLPACEKAVVAIEVNDGAGSGVIISEDGLVLTAAHVIGKSGRKLSVRLADGTKASAVSLGGSEISDAGMIKITGPGPWPYTKIAPSGSTSIGDWCFALGHPGGFDKKRGIIVRVGRVIAQKDETMQTDSRLLGGDSGGPLFDFDGNVIAIHSRISRAPDENYHVPVDSFHANWDFFKNQKLLTLDDLVKGGFLGLSCEEYEASGLLVTKIVEETPAEKSGLLKDDILLSLNGEKLDTREELTILVSSMNAGDLIVLEYLRNGKLLSSKIKLGNRPK
ncbi:MAG: hypothetical protein CMI27_03245 [Opitutae bacterium]|nr:hypothetical protein [Opitutae bacterium]